MSAAATALSLSFSSNSPPHLHLHLRAHPFTPPPPYLHTQFSTLPNVATRSHFRPSFSHSPPSPPPPSTATADTSVPFLDDPFRPLKFLTNDEFEKLKFLESYSYFQELKSGHLTVRVMRAEEMDETVKLLAESFADSMLLPPGYVPLLRFLVKKYLIERRSVMPHAVTLIGFYRERTDEDEEEGEELAGTVEVCFDKRGSNASPPSPTPPKNSPYICNMTVKEQLRRKRIGWHLLKASEELISRMSSEREVYLHCRMIDLGPFNLYMKAGYQVIKTDGFLVLLMFQRRKHLMCKELPPVIESSLELDSSGSNNEQVPDVEES
ncbi:LOW QUALITY PROTEIN: uncharacterized protein LOC116211999 [Punica granatum]|uniref:LOW QUALITY PROTEIN: uncharacterized protein LOC116211999 n=1 Tax=Punica granatum TaxID=22663 RepID=A0A6P8EAZ3_PUNGR|nr:LOW QUALITY PROTEIN: uncharacterized protein LOC116211999 [Punica granatum]